MGRRQGRLTNSLSNTGNHSLPGHLGAISSTVWTSWEIPWRMARISGSGGNAYKSCWGHSCASASWPKGLIVSSRENHRRQCVESREAKRSTSALPYCCQMACTTSGCSLHSPG